MKRLISVIFKSQKVVPDTSLSYESISDIQAAKYAMEEYDHGIRHGGEPHYPQWAADILYGKNVYSGLPWRPR